MSLIRNMHICVRWAAHIRSTGAGMSATDEIECVYIPKEYMRRMLCMLWCRAAVFGGAIYSGRETSICICTRRARIYTKCRHNRCPRQETTRDMYAVTWGASMEHVGQQRRGSSTQGGLRIGGNQYRSERRCRGQCVSRCHPRPPLLLGHARDDPGSHNRLLLINAH